MARRTLQEIREDGHWPKYWRESAVYSPFNRPLYGNNVKCQCGWEYRGHAGFTKRRSITITCAVLRQRFSWPAVLAGLPSGPSI